MREDMQVRNLSPHTQRAYIESDQPIGRGPARMPAGAAPGAHSETEHAPFASPYASAIAFGDALEIMAFGFASSTLEVDRRTRHAHKTADVPRIPDR
jgi:hypothetical protein